MNKNGLDIFGIRQRMERLYNDSGVADLVKYAVDRTPVLRVFSRFLPMAKGTGKPRGELLPAVEEIKGFDETSTKKQNDFAENEFWKDSSKKTSQLAEEVEHLRKALEESKLQMLGQTTELRNEVHDLEKRNRELLEKIVQLTQKERALSKSVLDAQFQGSGVKADKEKLEQEFRDLRRRVEDSREEMKQTEVARKQAENRLKEEEQKVVRLQEELKNTQAKVDKLSEEGQNNEQSRLVAEKRLQENGACLKRLEAELAEARRNVDEIQAERRRVRASQKVSQVSELQSAVSQLQSAVKELRDVVNVDEDTYHPEPEQDAKPVPKSFLQKQDEPVRKTFVKEGPMGSRDRDEYHEDSSSGGAPDMPAELRRPDFPSEDGNGTTVVLDERVHPDDEGEKFNRLEESGGGMNVAMRRQRELAKTSVHHRMFHSKK